MAGESVIYGLVDPRDGVVRYVGKATQPSARLRQHLRARQHKTPSGDWVDSLICAGLLPAMVVLETVDTPIANDAERRWIAFYREQGNDLLNLTDGGDGGSRKGRVLSPEGEARRLAAVRAANAARGPVSEETRAKMRAAKLGGKHSAEHNAKIGAALAGKPKSAEHVANARAGLLGVPKSDEHRAAVSRGKMGQSHPQSEETRRRISLTRIERFGNGKRRRSRFPEHLTASVRE